MPLSLAAGLISGDITVPVTWEDVVDLLLSVLGDRGLDAPKSQSGTMKE